MSNDKKFNFLRKSNRRKAVVAMSPAQVAAEIEEETSELKGIKKISHRFVLWLQNNARGIKNGLFAVVIAGVLAAAVTIFLSIRAEQQSEEFHVLLKDYEKNKLIPEGKEKEEAFKALISKADALSERFLVSNGGKNGLLISALSHLELKDKVNFAHKLEKFSKKYSFDNLGTIAGFYAAFAFESNFDLEKALSIYQKLMPVLEVEKQEKTVKFHVGRIRYLQNDLAGAEKIMLELKNIDPVKEQFGYVAEVDQYLTLIQIRKSQQTTAASK